MGVATMLIFVVPQVITTLLSAIIAKLSTVSSAFALLQIIPALISLVALPLLVFVQWSWWKSYGVAKWFQILMVVALVASVALGLYGAIQGIAGAVSAVRSGGSAVVEPDVPTSDTPATIPTPDTPTGTGTPTTTAPTTTAPSTTPTTTTTTPTTSLKTPEVAVPTTTKVRVDEGYAQYAQRRAEIEALLERDPTIIDRSERVRGLYQSLLQRTGDAEDQVNRDFRKSPSALNPLQEKARKSRVYELTRETVKDLHRELFGS
jgi:hypothetical protein